MFLLTEIKNQIMGNRGRSILMILASLFLLGAMAFYLGSMQTNENALLELGDKIPVKVQIVVEDGSRGDGIHVTTATHDALLTTGVRDVRATCVVTGAMSEEARMQAPFRNHSGGDVSMLGVSSVRAMPLSRVNYTYAAGFDETVMESSEACCILDEKFAADKGLALGDSISLAVYYFPQGYGEYLPLGEQTLNIVGLFSSVQPCEYSMLVPTEWLRVEADKQGLPYFGYASMSMAVDDPLHLNEFKERLLEAGMIEPVNKTIDYRLYDGCAAVVEDEVYTKTANKFREIISVYRNFMIPFFVLIAALSALMTFLVLRNSRREMAIASSLGKTRAQIRRTYLVTILILYAIGCIAAAPFILLFTGIGAAGTAALSGLFLCCGCAGAFIALLLLLRFDPMELLTKVD